LGHGQNLTTAQSILLIFVPKGQLDLLEASRSSFLTELEGIFELSTWGVKSCWLANTQKISQRCSIRGCILVRKRREHMYVDTQNDR
jgi:hypothetical protein